MSSYSRTDIRTNNYVHSESPVHGGLHKTCKTYCGTRFIRPQWAFQEVRSNEASSPHTNTEPQVHFSLTSSGEEQSAHRAPFLTEANELWQSINLSPCISAVASVEELPRMLGSSSLNSLPPPDSSPADGKGSTSFLLSVQV